jgi:hypothetical protein
MCVCVCGAFVGLDNKLQDARYITIIDHLLLAYRPEDFKFGSNFNFSDLPYSLKLFYWLFQNKNKMVSKKCRKQSLYSEVNIPSAMCEISNLHLFVNPKESLLRSEGSTIGLRLHVVFVTSQRAKIRFTKCRKPEITQRCVVLKG